MWDDLFEVEHDARCRSYFAVEPLGEDNVDNGTGKEANTADSL
jgi:hypothetical protein